MDLQTRDRAAAHVAPLPSGQPGLRVAGRRPGARAAGDRQLTRFAAAWTAVAALIALGLAHDAGVAGPAALPAIARTGAVTVGLFALCGYGAARLLLPAHLRLGLYVLPIGAACSTLALTVLGLFHVPLKLSLAITLAAAAALALVARRKRGGTREASAAAGRTARLAAPLALAALIAAI